MAMIIKRDVVTCRETQVDNDKFHNKFMVSLGMGVSQLNVQSNSK